VEEWTWPPRYDEDYRLSADQKHWFPHRETMPAEQRDELILARIRDVMQYAWDNSPFYRRKWTDAGVHPAGIKTLEEFEIVPYCARRTCGPTRRRTSRSAATSVSPRPTSSTSMARRERRGGRPRSASTKGTGAASPTRTHVSCGPWGSARTTPCWWHRLSASTGDRGVPTSARSVSARGSFPSAPGRPGRRCARSTGSSRWVSPSSTALRRTHSTSRRRRAPRASTRHRSE
jgi:hypothetical protein